MDRPDEAFSGLPETARVDWAESSELLDARILFECNATFDGRYTAVCVYSDLVVIEDPREPGSRTDLRPADIRWWEIRDDAFEIEVVLMASAAHRARLPRPFRGPLAVALTKVLGPAALAA